MGLALFIAYLKTVSYLGLRGKSAEERERYDTASRFWARIFAINFAVGVVTGIPMEFQFGTNWAGFSKTAGGVIGQMLAMEGVFSFFLESSFLGLFLYGENRLGPKLHLASAFLVFLDRGCRDSLSLPRTRGCSTLSATRPDLTVSFSSPTLLNCF